MENYHEWLCNIVRADLPEHRRHYKLLQDLDNREFTYILPMDENRYEDGYDLRCEYMDLTNDSVYGPVSCLEVLIALSRRIEIEIMGEPGNDHIEKWFWIMIRNLDLDDESDDSYDHRFVEDKLDIWLRRRFKSNGKGSIFPTYKTDTDQREVDIWYQMQGYLMENYQI